jgi:hypothetical protein
VCEIGVFEAKNQGGPLLYIGTYRPLRAKAEVVVANE